jgi:hypothetical protein
MNDTKTNESPDAIEKIADLLFQAEELAVEYLHQTATNKALSTDDFAIEVDSVSSVWLHTLALVMTHPGTEMPHSAFVNLVSQFSCALEMVETSQDEVAGEGETVQ